ncbi:MAG: nucleotidyltransferase domain-containing protein [Legionellales bacterium]|nr:nucleotidyltransferase domain-containing protein [Legionellales bacterium]
MNSPDKKKYGLNDKDIAAIQTVLRCYPHIEKAILYGSRAKANYRHASDIDLTLQGEQLTYTDLVAIDLALDDLLLPYTIDLSIYHHIENPELLAHIQRVGQEFYVKSSSESSKVTNKD